MISWICPNEPCEGAQEAVAAECPDGRARHYDHSTPRPSLICLFKSTAMRRTVIVSSRDWETFSAWPVESVYN
ncbi:hypothetical protein CP97_14747 [Aurantiacibacter atlanticus]|uniref:Uncharacterized protein n=1 Tax=Aurantiacibacter atlanticus TaxID=1648404 RepID=A0A168M1V3_9SPHN|nr:hypothetical protein CP97_14747 [Aurantiacibacter atlanticus]